MEFSVRNVFGILHLDDVKVNVCVSHYFRIELLVSDRSNRRLKMIFHTHVASFSAPPPTLWTGVIWLYFIWRNTQCWKLHLKWRYNVINSGSERWGGEEWWTSLWSACPTSLPGCPCPSSPPSTRGRRSPRGSPSPSPASCSAASSLPPSSYTESNKDT